MPVERASDNLIETQREESKVIESMSDGHRNNNDDDIQKADQILDQPSSVFNSTPRALT